MQNRDLLMAHLEQIQSECNLAAKFIAEMSLGSPIIGNELRVSRFLMAISQEVDMAILSIAD